MRNINKVILVGNISRDPIGKEVGDGQPVTTFGIATHRYFTTKSGEKKSMTEFHNVVTWGALAHRCNETLRKGKLVYIEGYLKTRAFDIAEGKKSFRTEIVAYNMIILSKRDDGMSPGGEHEELLPDEPPAIEEALHDQTPPDDDNTF